MRAQTRTHLAIAELARRQHGVVTIWQLTGLGYSKARISRNVIAGRLHQIHRGVYAVGHTALSREALCLAAVLSCGTSAILSHRSAAWLWGMTERWRPVIDVTATVPRHSRDSICVHSSRSLALDDIAFSSEIPITAPARTLLDFAAVDPGYLPAALDRAARLGLLDLIAVDALLARSRGFRGVARLREALEVHRDPSFTRSGLERQFLRLVREAGLPRPATNFFIEGHELDAYWEPERFAVELDTYDHHGGKVAFEKDRLRQEELKLAGIAMTRITGARIKREPHAVMDRLRRLLTQRR